MKLRNAIFKIAGLLLAGTLSGQVAFAQVATPEIPHVPVAIEVVSNIAWFFSDLASAKHTARPDSNLINIKSEALQYYQRVSAYFASGVTRPPADLDLRNFLDQKRAQIVDNSGQSVSQRANYRQVASLYTTALIQLDYEIQGERCTQKANAQPCNESIKAWLIEANHSQVRIDLLK